MSTQSDTRAAGAPEAAGATEPGATESRVARLILVYASDSGPVSAFVDSTKKLLQLGGCTLCQVTHGVLTEKADWKSCKEELGVPIEALHQDELEPPLTGVVDGRLPSILAEADDGELHFLVSPEVIARCNGSAADLRGKILFHAARQGLAL